VADPRGFLKVRERELPPSRPVPVRLKDYRDVVAERTRAPEELGVVQRQASRCMDCGIPFCHSGCPLGNLIPDWNHFVWKGQWAEASDRLHATNNFPEFTGKICPAPCETACVLGINSPAVTIKNVEITIVEEAFARGLITPQVPHFLTGQTVAVVGSGPSGLAAAQQLTRAGHTVAVFERADRIGGLLRYGVPDFKLEKRLIDRRIEQMEAEGTRFRTGVQVGIDITWTELLARYDAVLVAIGSTTPRLLTVPGSDLEGVVPAVRFLTQNNKVRAGDDLPDQLTATGKHVVVIGGGDTGSDCVGTSLRHGAASVTSLEIVAQPPAERPANQPWPTYPMTFKVSSSHEEGGAREYQASTIALDGDEQGRVRALRLATVERTADGRFAPVEGTEREIPADLVLLAMGFVGPETATLVEQTGADITAMGTVARGDDFATSVPGMYVAGDAGRGQSLVVWAIAEGRAAAAGVDAWLRGSTELHRPVAPTDRPLRV
jgi:glutamate synthase (NADPH/NADH) small chain